MTQREPLRQAVRFTGRAEPAVAECEMQADAAHAALKQADDLSRRLIRYTAKS
ncbi:DUF3053 family protein [Shigella flexneri]